MGVTSIGVDAYAIFAPRSNSNVGSWKKLPLVILHWLIAPVQKIFLCWATQQAQRNKSTQYALV